jgi:hypothetical protein
VRIEFALPHALTEAFKDGLTVDELKTAPDRIPYHVVLEYYPGDPLATVVTTYIPDTAHWEPDWKRRKKLRRKRRR